MHLRRYTGDIWRDSSRYQVGHVHVKVPSSEIESRLTNMVYAWVQVGSLTSIFPIAYGMSKFISGVLGARSSPTVMLAGGLMATAVVNVLFGFGTSMAWFCSFWALNGILQVTHPVGELYSVRNLSGTSPYLVRNLSGS
jgi:hypothetical protein